MPRISSLASGSLTISLTTIPWRPEDRQRAEQPDESDTVLEDTEILPAEIPRHPGHDEKGEQDPEDPQAEQPPGIRDNILQGAADSEPVGDQSVSAPPLPGSYPVDQNGIICEVTAH